MVAVSQLGGYASNRMRNNVGLDDFPSTRLRTIEPSRSRGPSPVGAANGQMEAKKVNYTPRATAGRLNS